jgi:hypothetical protein
MEAKDGRAGGCLQQDVVLVGASGRCPCGVRGWELGVTRLNSGIM